MKFDPKYVFLGIPTVGGKEAVGASILTDSANRFDGQKGWRFLTRHMNGKRPVEFARNCLAAEFLKTECGILWYVDYDTVASPNAFDLLKVDADIVGGIYPFLASKDDKERPPVSWGAYDKHPKIEGAYSCVPFPENGEDPVQTVDAVCMGNTLIRRKVLEDPRMSLGTAEKNPDIPCLFRTIRDMNGEELATEDMDFCERARSLGYSIMSHTGVRFGHIKNVDIGRIFDLMSEMFQRGMNRNVPA